ncbi:hypothetical protein BT69DRAFT_1292665 [Atractiella rhizophila]|nr:hypothetical protein BT69DRAFT_1292665 [Atractiella rhizophila]
MAKSKISFPTVSKLIAKFTPAPPSAVPVAGVGVGVGTPSTPRNSKFVKNKYGSLRKSDGSVRMKREDGTEEILEICAPANEERERDMGELNKWADSLLSNLEKTLDDMTMSLKDTMDNTSVRMSEIEDSLSDLLKWSNFDIPTPALDSKASFSSSDSVEPCNLPLPATEEEDGTGSEYSVY